MTKADVLVVGAGLAGLSCALDLREKGFSTLILEASDGVGGRVRTDPVEGFLLERGCPHLLTAYPEAARRLDFKALDLRPLTPGAWVRHQGEFREILDPWHHPWRAVGGWSSRIGSLLDRMRFRSLQRDVLSCPTEQIFARPETTASKLLNDIGISEPLLNQFLRPFFGQIFLEKELHSSSRMLEFVLQMLALGEMAVPANGMGAIPEQLARRLPEESVRLNARVAAAAPGYVALSSGEELAARAVVVAAEEPEAARLTGAPPPSRSHSVIRLYYAAPEPPVNEPILVVNGNNQWPVNSLWVPSLAAPKCAPKGQALVAVTVLGRYGKPDEEIEAKTLEQLQRWFGAAVAGWRRLALLRIPYAQPDAVPPAIPLERRPVRLSAGLYVCGDHRENPSMEGALVSGRRAAEAVAEDLAGGQSAGR
ncbi:MAG: FAD-dependent oxidoreductase [Acidobacteria bacterium]|nr:FAD-dependent oxidoreductase [Acidobacteriota bacterium]